MAIHAIISISIAPLYEQATHRAELGTQAVMGTQVFIVEETSDWYKVQTPDGYQAWCEKDAVVVLPDCSGYLEKDKIIFTSRYGLAYSDERLSVPATDLCAGCSLVLLEKLRVAYKALLPNEKIVYLSQQDALEIGVWRATRIHSEQEIVKDSLHYLGTPYLWGGTSPVGVDCSGFTKMIYALSGIGLKRNASQQCLTGREVDLSNGYVNLQPADLVFFASQPTGGGQSRVSHVGISLGGSEYIHASTMVRINSLDPSSSLYHPRAERLVSARRIFGMVGTDGIYLL